MRRIVLSIITLVILILPGQLALAQSIDSSEIEGLASAYGRAYVSPDTDPESLDDAMSEGDVIGITIYTFATADDASAYLAGEISGMSEQFGAAESQTQGVDMHALDDFDREGSIIVVSTDEMDLTITGVIFQDEVDVILIIWYSQDDADVAAENMLALAAYVRDSESGDSEVEFHADGTSTGGVFDRMPANEDDLVGGMIAVNDEDLLAPQD